MQGPELRQTREGLGLSQRLLAERLGTTRKTINCYEAGKHRIPEAVVLAVAHLSAPRRLPLLGTVAAGNPIEPFTDAEVVEVPPEMVGKGETFALRVKGYSMRDEGILPGDVVIVEKKATARNGQTVIALIKNEATIKKYYRKDGRIELRPANEELQPIMVAPSEDFQILGVLIGVMRYCK